LDTEQGWLWPSIGKAFRVAADRVNRNTRDCAPENHVKSPQEIGARPNEAKHCQSKTRGKHAEENTRPQECRCALLCALTRGKFLSSTTCPEQYEYEHGAEDDHTGEAQAILPYKGATET
jgi:hypothetical protein